MIALLGATPGLTAGPGVRAPEPPPVIILIVADALRADHLSCYAQRPAQPPVGVDTQSPGAGYPANHTPHIDALARDSVRYRDASAQASWTKPSVATIFTSLYPSSHRAIVETDLLPDDVLTLPEVLREQGYHTVGLTANTFTSQRFNFQQGYDEYTYLDSTHPFLAVGPAPTWGISTTIQQLRAASLALSAGPASRRYQDAGVVNQHVFDWLDERPETPFFLYLHYMDPHQPYYAHPYNGVGAGAVAADAPAERAPRLRALYHGEVAYLDAQLGALFAQLKARGLYDDALIILTADHGEELYEHENWGHGRTLYQEQLHVPLIIKYPGSAGASAIDTGLARSLDIAPTVLDVAGVPVPAAMQGVSLRPGASAARARSAFAEENRQGNVIRSLRDSQYKLILVNEGNPRGLPAVALFDLRADPGEQHNLADQKPDTVRQLRAGLDEALAYAEGRAVQGQSRELDAATRERLRELGY
ncbi:MAG: sulfatase-like hydrolase/transferase [Chloroflexi bacterium]|nr:sulfatase-like hydrolase/transferase [Chloroflexota bacterium]MBU1749599.1 sulfatase-like hydrolase/transferase [Chloroflexota bacterium]MBU1877487.1 sulfatase-like hydrolase/transferase [Chloroflexota bacterium]